MKNSLLINKYNLFSIVNTFFAKTWKENQRYIFRICPAIWQDFEASHFLKPSFHHHSTKLYYYDYIFLKLEIMAFNLV